MTITINKNIEIKKIIRIKSSHEIYRQEMTEHFDYYFSSVEPEITDHNSYQEWVIDFSEPRFHRVRGYTRSPIHFPSFSEPLSTIKEYTDFAQLHQGDTVIDLGAYSGLSSIIFKDCVGPEGRVIAVEADATNIKSVKINFEQYKKITGMDIEYIHAAIWNHTNGIEFSKESNVGSSAMEIVKHWGDRGAERILIPSETLDSLADKFNLNKVDFLKVDVEGAESYIFNDTKFFERYRPKVYIELHRASDIPWDQVPIRIMEKFDSFGYTCGIVDPVEGSFSLPMMACSPK